MDHDRERSIDQKIIKWKNRPLKHLTTEQLNELVADLREEVLALEQSRQEISAARRTTYQTARSADREDAA